MEENVWNDENLIELLRRGGVVVMPTDTIYGIVGRADMIDVVSRISKLKKRSPEKKFITLIADWGETKKFGVDSDAYTIPEYDKPTSVIIKDTSFRVPRDEKLRELLHKTGPLIVPSANPEGEPPAETIVEAKKYFGGAVDLYIDGGTLLGKASQLIRLHEDGSVRILRA